MYIDPRIKAGANLDGTLEYTVQPDGTNMSQVALHGLKQPFLLIGSSSTAEGSDIHREPSWASFWQHQSGWKADFTLKDSEHQSLTDAKALLSQLPPSTPVEGIGTVNAHRAVAADRALVTAFFDRFLKGHDNHLLDGKPSGYPLIFEQ